MSAKKRVSRPQIIEMLEEFQAEEFNQLLDPQIKHLFSGKERQASMNKHDKSSQYFDSNPQDQGEGEKDELLKQINQLRLANGAKSINDIIEQRAACGRSKAVLFKRWKNEQREEIDSIIKEMEALRVSEQEKMVRDRRSGNLANQRRQYQRQYLQRGGKKVVCLASLNNTSTALQFTADDLQKLTPNQDLNDTIIEFYLRIVKMCFINQQLTHKVHFFSTFFFHKLITDNFQHIFGDQIIANRLSKQHIQQIRQAVEKNYKNVKRWTKVDIFQKEVLVFPINAFSHWFCVIVLNPSRIWSKQGCCQLIYCDSLFQNKDVIFEPLKEYLRLQLLEKKGRHINRYEQNVFAYQLLLPKQTNTHDCGLYMLTYIEELLSLSLSKLNQLKFIKNRMQLGLFPRMLIFTMRQRLLRFIDELSSMGGQQRTKQICSRFAQEKRSIISSKSERIGYQKINEQQFKKYKEMFLFNFNTGNQSKEEQDFQKLLMFYFDAQVNYFQKNSNQ